MTEMKDLAQELGIPLSVLRYQAARQAGVPEDQHHLLTATDVDTFGRQVEVLAHLANPPEPPTPAFVVNPAQGQSSTAPVADFFPGILQRMAPR